MKKLISTYNLYKAFRKAGFSRSFALEMALV